MLYLMHLVHNNMCGSNIIKNTNKYVNKGFFFYLYLDKKSIKLSSYLFKKYCIYQRLTLVSILYYFVSSVIHYYQFTI